MSDDVTDPEVDACAVVLAALRPLDVLARKRVLEWAGARLVPGEADPMGLVEASFELYKTSVLAIREHAKQNGDPSDADKKLYSEIPGAKTAPT